MVYMYYKEVSQNRYLLVQIAADEVTLFRVGITWITVSGLNVMKTGSNYPISLYHQAQRLLRQKRKGLHPGDWWKPVG